MFFDLKISNTTLDRLLKDVPPDKGQAFINSAVTPPCNVKGSGDIRQYCRVYVTVNQNLLTYSL